jgi:hypothetical protein
MGLSRDPLGSRDGCWFCAPCVIALAADVVEVRDGSLEAFGFLSASPIQRQAVRALACRYPTLGSEEPLIGCRNSTSKVADSIFECRNSTSKVADSIFECRNSISMVGIPPRRDPNSLHCACALNPFMARAAQGG